jgi:uncharacterized protein (TIGR02145 family)
MRIDGSGSSSDIFLLPRRGSREFRLLCALSFACAGAASSLDLSGKVVDPDGSGCGGVTVTLSGRSLSAVTASDGTWALGTASALVRPMTSRKETGSLLIHEGRLRVVLVGRDPSGRPQAGDPRFCDRQTVLAARSLGSAPDTILYSRNGVVFLRDTVGASRSGMVRVYDTTWNAGIVYGYLTDERDGQIYRTVRIGSQVWMAQNLNYKGAGADSGLLYDSSPDSVRKYGRMYPWTLAMGLADSCKTNACSLQVVMPQRGICPTGWHVPSDVEWQSLEVAIGMSAATAAENGFRVTTVGAKLMSAQGWYSGGGGTDVYGFRVLPGGGVASGPYERFCTASEYDKYWAWNRSFYNGNPSINRGPDPKSSRYSLRCLQN